MPEGDSSVRKGLVGPFDIVVNSKSLSAGFGQAGDMKHSDFDAACLLVGQIGGEKWLAYNITTPMLDKFLINISKQIFEELDVGAVCIASEIINISKS